MDRFVVRPGGPLHGTVRAGGAKNSALKLMAACLLAPGRHVLAGVPRDRGRRDHGGGPRGHRRAGRAWARRTRRRPGGPRRRHAGDPRPCGAVRARREDARLCRGARAAVGPLGTGQRVAPRWRRLREPPDRHPPPRPVDARCRVPDRARQHRGARAGRSRRPSCRSAGRVRVPESYRHRQCSHGCGARQGDDGHREHGARTRGFGPRRLPDAHGSSYTWCGDLSHRGRRRGRAPSRPPCPWRHSRPGGGGHLAVGGGYGRRRGGHRGRPRRSHGHAPAQDG